MNEMNEMNKTSSCGMTFFADAIGWGDVLFSGFHTDNYGQFFGLLVFSFITGFITIRFSKIIVPDNNIYHFLFYTTKSCLHFISMNLAMTLNVWIFLCVCLGQGAGYIKQKKEPPCEYVPEDCQCVPEECQCEPEECHC